MAEKQGIRMKCKAPKEGHRRMIAGVIRSGGEEFECVAPKGYPGGNEAFAAFLEREGFAEQVGAKK